MAEYEFCLKSRSTPNSFLPSDVLETLGPFIREKIRRVLAKTRLIFSRINGPIVSH